MRGLIYSRFLEQLLSGGPRREKKVQRHKETKKKATYAQSLTAQNMVYALIKKLFEIPDTKGKSEAVTDASNGACKLAWSGIERDTQHGLGETC